jgi:hypothetical protein
MSSVELKEKNYFLLQKISLQRDKTGNEFLGICARDRHPSGQCGNGGKTARQPVKKLFIKAPSRTVFCFKFSFSPCFRGTFIS